MLSKTVQVHSIGKTFLVWSIVVFGTELHGILITTVCQSLKLLVASTCELPDVVNCQFHNFATAPLRPVHILSPDQESGIHCLIICGIQLLTPNNLGETWRKMYLFVDIPSSLGALCNHALQTDIYLLTYFGTEYDLIKVQSNKSTSIGKTVNLWLRRDQDRSHSSHRINCILVMHQHYVCHAWCTHRWVKITFSLWKLLCAAQMFTGTDNCLSRRKLTS